MRAVREADRRVRRLNIERATKDQPLVEYGLGLHIGDVMYGNIGVPERLEFSVIGPAANETARLESLTKEIGHNVVVSDDFARNIKGGWISLGQRNLNSPLKKALLTGFHSTAKHNATKAVSPSSETMRTI